MKSLKTVIYLFDDQIIFYKGKELKEIIKTKITKHAVFQGKIVKPNEFYKQFEKIIKETQMLSGFINNNVICLNEPHINQADTEALKIMLEKVGFNQTEFINITSLCNLKRNNVWIIANKQYLHIIYIDYRNKVKRLYLCYELFNNNINLIINHLKLFVKRKSIILLGNYPHISDLAKKIEQEISVKTYYIEDMNAYLLKKIKSTLNN